jgi:hypothetical protein
MSCLRKTRTLDELRMHHKKKRPSMSCLALGPLLPCIVARFRAFRVSKEAFGLGF